MPFPVDRKFIEHAEASLGVRFPASFVAKMLLDNGGEIETSAGGWQLYPFLDRSDRKRIARTCNDIIRETASAREWSGFPEEGIAIGANDSGDLLVFLPLTGQVGVLASTVHWWDHETGELRRVADDFGDLIS